MPAGIDVMVLGAGQDVGRSCVVMNFSGTYIMFDCGMHLSYRDARRFPNFKLLPFHGRLSEMLAAVVVTHFHLDHCAALPYLTEVHGYAGPIYMTHPTKAIMPVMLEDYAKVVTDRQGDRQWYSRADVAACMRKTVGVDLNQQVVIAPGIELRALYAGHVLGGAMFHVTVNGASVLYTGDYNTSPERHLGAAQLECLRPDLLVTESTYATTLRESKRARERDFLGEVLRCVGAGGKVLVPVFAVGRAQELLLLVEEAWRRLGLVGRVPLYFSGTMAVRANALYRACVNWASPGVRAPGARHTAFAFGLVTTWDAAAAAREGPCVLFATPGMLNGGVSLQVFKAWAPDPRNLVVLPGFQAAGTIGGRLQAGSLRELRLGSEVTPVRCKVRYMGFSAHADAKGILQMVAAVKPRATLLVHGDKPGMHFLASRITHDFGVPCVYPPTGGDWTHVPTQEQPLLAYARLGPHWLVPGGAGQGPGQGAAAAAAAPRGQQQAGPMEVDGQGGRQGAAASSSEEEGGEGEEGEAAPALPAPVLAIPVDGVLLARRRQGQEGLFVAGEQAVGPADLCDLRLRHPGTEGMALAHWAAPYPPFALTFSTS